MTHRELCGQFRVSIAAFDPGTQAKMGENSPDRSNTGTDRPEQAKMADDGLEGANIARSDLIVPWSVEAGYAM